MFEAGKHLGLSHQKQEILSWDAGYMTDNTHNQHKQCMFLIGGTVCHLVCELNNSGSPVQFQTPSSGIPIPLNLVESAEDVEVASF